MSRKSTTNAATLPMTASDFAEFVERPESRDRNYELERGRVIELSLGSVRHGAVCANAAYVLGNFAKMTKGGFVCCNNPGIWVERDPDTVRGPDIAYFSGTLDIEDEHRFTETPPILIAEVVDVRDRVEAILGRVQEYLVFGTPTVLVIDPLSRSVNVFDSRSNAALLQSEQSIRAINGLPGFRCKVAEFFALPGQ
jgi:Uma2 family endonuclease